MTEVKRKSPLVRYDTTRHHTMAALIDGPVSIDELYRKVKFKIGYTSPYGYKKATIEVLQNLGLATLDGEMLSLTDEGREALLNMRELVNTSPSKVRANLYTPERTTLSLKDLWTPPTREGSMVFAGLSSIVAGKEVKPPKGFHDSELQTDEIDSAGLTEAPTTRAVSGELQA